MITLPQSQMKKSYHFILKNEHGMDLKWCFIVVIFWIEESFAYLENEGNNGLHFLLEFVIWVKMVVKNSWNYFCLRVQQNKK